jgi:zinc transport system substrate-binding protein
MKILISILFLINIVYAQTNIVVSILPQQTFVEKIGGDKVKVSTMVKPGSDPHSYEPKPSQMQDISNANIYFPIGLEFEATWLDKFADQNKNMKFVEMTKDVQYIEMKEHDHHHDEHEHHEENHENEEDEHHGKDPHTWVSPSNVKIMAKNIYDTLVEVDPSNKEYFEKNYSKFIEEINQTDKKIKEILSVLPENSKFMVFHPSWGYFANEYNLIQLAIEVEGKEPKPKVLQKIIDEAKEENVKAIFTQAEFSDKSAKTIASELKIKVLKETPLAKDWSENLIKMANAIANNK